MGNPTRAEVEAELAAFTAAQAQNAQQEVKEPAPDQERKPIDLEPVENAEPVEPILIEQEEKKDPAPTEDERQKDPEYWKHRFQTLEGMTRKEKDELAKQQQEMLRQNQELLEFIRDRELSKTQENVQPAPVLPTKARDVTDEMLLEMYSEEDIEEYGAEALRREVATANQLQVLQDKVDTMARMTQDQQAQDQQRAEMGMFWKRVEAIVPDAELMDRTDSRWSDWLDKDYRREMLSAAMAKGDAEAVAKAMLACKAESESPKQPEPKAALPTVEEQAIPGTTVHVPASPSSPVVTYKQSQVDRYYEDRSRGKLADRYSQAEILQLETQITRAAAEGRIVPG